MSIQKKSTRKPEAVARADANRKAAVRKAAAREALRPPSMPIYLYDAPGIRPPSIPGGSGVGTDNPAFKLKDMASTIQGQNTSVGTPTGTRGTLTNDMRGGPISGPGAPIPQPGLTSRVSSVPADGGASYDTPAGGNMSKAVLDYNTGAPATSTFQGGTSGGIGGGMPGATGMPNTSMLPAGAAFKKGGSVRAEKMASGGMASKVSSASKRGDGIAQRGKTKGRMC